LLLLGKAKETEEEVEEEEEEEVGRQSSGVLGNTQ